LRLALGVTTTQTEWVAEMSTSDKKTSVTAREQELTSICTVNYEGQQNK
jgi:hypothetical protein